jgi:hypothetical protein
MRKFGWLSLMLSAGAMIGCGSDPAPTPTPTVDVPVVTDTAVATDTPPTPTDVRPTDVPRDTAPADAGASRAGAACTMPDPMGGADPACGDGELLCIPTPSTPICTSGCENNPSQTNERTQCGGAGSTCLTQGDGMNARSNCFASCRTAGTTAATGACRAGFVCTGWWFTHMGGTPDATGCFPHCSQNSDCPMGSMCNARTGTCGATGVDMTRLPDGSPCNPRMTAMVPGETQARNIQCRGICFSTSSDAPTQGICGSLMNIRASTMCYDDPENVAARAPQGTDNLAICIWRNCTSNSDCRSPHICRFPEDASDMPISDADPLCDFPTPAQRTGIVGDAGAPADAATDRPATTDAPAADVTPATDAATATDAGAADVSAATDGGSAG